MRKEIKLYYKLIQQSQNLNIHAKHIDLKDFYIQNIETLHELTTCWGRSQILWLSAMKRKKRLNYHVVCFGEVSTGSCKQTSPWRSALRGLTSLNSKSCFFFLIRHPIKIILHRNWVRCVLLFCSVGDKKAAEQWGGFCVEIETWAHPILRSRQTRTSSSDRGDGKLFDHFAGCHWSSFRRYWPHWDHTLKRRKLIIPLILISSDISLDAFDTNQESSKFNMF